MVRALAVLWLGLAGCADDACPYGSMLDGDEGLVVTEAEHPTGFGQAECTECHAIPQLHRHGCTPGVDDEAVRAIVSEEGVESCGSCHGANGVVEEGE